MRYHTFSSQNGTTVCLTNCLTTARHENSIRRTLTDGVNVLAWPLSHVESMSELLHTEEVAESCLGQRL